MSSTEIDTTTSLRTHSSKRAEELRIYQYCPERPYVELEIPEFVRGKDVKHVVFTIVSHDQGMNHSIIQYQATTSTKHTNTYE